MTETSSTLRPVQVFLRTDQFIDLKKTKPFGGGKKDFFAGNDDAFATHKTEIRRKIGNIANTVRTQDRSTAYVQLELQENALAKSYRPISSLFTEGNGFAFVGSGRVGELIFQCTPQALERLNVLIDVHAEVEPQFKRSKKTGELRKYISGYRSELGAISDLELYDSAHKLRFSAAEALEWFKKPGVIGGYVVELFRPDFRLDHTTTIETVEQFIAAIKSFGGGIVLKSFLPQTNPTRLGVPNLAFTIQLIEGTTRIINLPFSDENRGLEYIPTRTEHQNFGIDQNLNRHAELLAFLSEQTLVRSIELPPIIELSPEASNSSLLQDELPQPNPEVSYPIVGIIDGGVSNCLAQWKSGEAGVIPSSDRDETHGTFIAGLISCGGHLNPHISSTLEPIGCKFFDVDMFPRKELRSSYYTDADDLFDLLEEKIKVAKAAGVRIFNFSFGLSSTRDPIGYSIYADRLDRIAIANDVIFIVSAGNLAQNAHRPIWPAQANDAISMLATFNKPQEILAPAEHFFGLTVGAINPPGVANHTPDVPTTYTRRGPGVGGARKPDICHYGGISASLSPANDTRLNSILPNGSIGTNCGTSFAAPNAAATLATLNHRLDGSLSRESLLALTVHRASRSPKLQHKALRHISRDFVGFGLGKVADEIILDDANSISLVFNGVLEARKVLEFPFIWPESLATPTGNCKGKVDITLAYTPPIDPAFKEECQRVQLEAYFKQEEVSEDGEIAWINQLKHDGSGKVPGMNLTERYLLMTGLKWSPIKRYNATMKNGRGNSTNWKLSVESLTRAGASFPTAGIPFTVILTISDPKGEAPIHEEVRRGLSARSLEIADIQIAHRIRQRR